MDQQDKPGDEPITPAPSPPPEPPKRTAAPEKTTSVFEASGEHHAPSAKVRTFALILLTLVGAAAGFFGGWLGSRHTNDGTTIERQQVVLKTQGELISSIAKNVGPSVVSVEVRSTGLATDRFFGTTRQTEQESAGTGIIIADNGLIMTNRHVVPLGTTSVSVTLSDGTKFDDVDVVGRTSTKDVLDVAFLKIKDLKGTKLKAARLGDSSKMEVGQPVIAIGNALGQFENTVTSGIISGHGRSVQASSDDGSEIENLEDLFQTDAAINQGNSGGPLVNMDGEVIGVNTAVAGGNAEGIGFAMPMNNLKGLVDGVIKTGKLQRPYLGIMYVSLTDDVAKYYGLDVKRGAYVAPAAIVGEEPVIKDGPADRAGVKASDVITKVDDQAVDEKHSLTSLLGKKSVGDKVTLTILRDGKEVKITVTLEAAPQQ
jgi:serine protease Do